MHSERITSWVVVPAYNESRVLGETISELLSVFINIVVVDDCSSDQTSDVAYSAGAHVCRHPVNLGQGAALATGIAYALQNGASEIVTFDGDGQHSVEDARILCELRRLNDVDAVLGSRFLGRTVGISARKKIFLLLATLFTRLTTGLALTDTHNGLRVFSRHAAHQIRIRQNRMAHASEILHEIAEHKLSYIEAPCTVTYSEYSKTKGQKMSGAFAILSDLMLGRLHR